MTVRLTTCLLLGVGAAWTSACMEEHLVTVYLGDAAGAQPGSGTGGDAGVLDAGSVMGTCQAQTDSEDGGTEMANVDASEVVADASVPDFADGSAADASALDATTTGGASPLDAAVPPSMPVFGGTPVLVSSAFSLAEGPLWDACRGGLLFVDVDAARIYLLNPPSQLTVIRENSNYANGLAFDPTGALWATEMGGATPGRVTRTDRAGDLTVAADHGPACTDLHTPDDLVVRSDGTVYFTDPTFPHGSFLNFSLGTSPVYRLAPRASGYQIVSEAQVSGPNGIELSPDEKTLYVNSYLGGQVLRYTVAADGSLSADGVVASG
ncbi:MAG TPA: SMP-30/gluconolactonase/LRE family protein, partial [Polyangiaceae bacterium]|nr:SMP-30/gluconolactonase/LRE family protein [Polyangiaceae bacterium]